ncbi:MAG: bile acid:sodium symporter [Planctomycetes bacterium]|nr:bile acid:sodium symporter [Planctomycetota bacterium]
MLPFLGRHWFLAALAIGVGATLLWPAALHHVTDWWEPRIAVAFALLLMAWTMPVRSLVAEARQPYASAWAVVLSYGLAPACAWLLGMLAPKDVQIGLILVASVPCTLSSAVLWTRLAGGNEATALLTVLGTTFTSWFLTTAWLFWLTGAVVEIHVGAMMLDLTLSLILPVLIGQALRGIRRCAEFADDRRIVLGLVSQGFILAIVLKAGVAVGDKLHADQAWDAMIFLTGIILAIVLHLVSLAIGYFSCGWLGFDRGRQIAVAFSASQKTLQVSLLLYDQYFKKDYAFAVIPLLAYHIGQLLLDTLIAKRLANRTSEPEA